MLCVLFVEEIKNKSAHPTKWAFCYCHKFNRFGWLKINRLTSKTEKVSSGRCWKLLPPEQCGTLEMFLNQFVWQEKRGYKYRNIGKSKKLKPIHQDIWEWHNGEIPSGFVVDHKNRNKKDNRIENLRLVNTSQNRMNTKVKNKTGERYIHIMYNNKFRVRVRKNVVGYYDTLEQAKSARNNYCQINDKFAMDLILDDAAW